MVAEAVFGVCGSGARFQVDGIECELSAHSGPLGLGGSIGRLRVGTICGPCVTP